MRERGAFIWRERLLRALGIGGNSTVILAAPSGYGKTTLVEQLRNTEHDAEWVWVPGLGSDFGYTQAIGALGAVLGLVDIAGQASLVDVGYSEVELGVLIGERLRQAKKRDIYVCFDDVDVLEFGWLSELRSLFEPVVDDLRLVATTRVTDRAVLRTAKTALVLTASDLAFTVEEVFALVAPLDERFERDDALRLCRMTAGQPALLAVLVPFIAAAEAAGIDAILQPGGKILGIQNYLKRLAEEQLPTPLHLALYAASVMGTGTLDDLRAVAGVDYTDTDMELLRDAVPLFDLDRQRWRVHSLAQEAFSDSSFLASFDESCREVDRAVVERLSIQGRLVRAFQIAWRAFDADEVCEWLAKYGTGLRAQGRARLLVERLETVPPSVLLRYPPVVLLMAVALRDLNATEEALRKAAVARQMSEVDGDSSTAAEATILLARIHLDEGHPSVAYESLRRVMRGQWNALSPSVRVLVLSHLALASSLIGLIPETSETLTRLASECRTPGISEEALGRALLQRAAVEGWTFGRWPEAARCFGRVARMRNISYVTRLCARGDYAAALVETGRLAQGRHQIEAVLRQCEELGLRGHYYSFLAVKGVILVLDGRNDQGMQLLREAIRGSEENGDYFFAYQDRQYLVLTLNALGRHDEALEEAESTLEYFAAETDSPYTLTSEIDFAGCTAYAGNSLLAIAVAKKAYYTARHGGLAHIALRAALVLAYCFLQQGRLDAVKTILSENASYIASGGGNLQLALSIRACPDLLPLLVSAVTAEALSAHPASLLRDLLPDGNTDCVVDGERRMKDRDHLGAKVILLGGLDVTARGTAVAPRAWRKRKARLLFAMLLVKRGQDVPRDQIFEHLWPDMDEDRARNNFYVVWSAMKSALMGGEGKNRPCPYVENVGGVCRIVRENVRTDLDEFDEELERARSAESEGRTDDALDSYHRLIDIYRGDLLPGDLYDDWFAPMRDKYRQEFSDAMLHAATLHHEHGRSDQAVKLVRAALQFDAWREDLYQAAIRCQMASGQRGAAIETYMACRTRLADDLGLDPSAETRRLYDDILAMEEAATA